MLSRQPNEGGPIRLAAIIGTTAKLIASGPRARSKKGLVIDKVQQKNLGPLKKN